MARQGFRLKSVWCKAVCLFILFNVFFLFGGDFFPVYAQGIITTIAGNGEGGFSGDGGLAISARIDNPYGITVDSKGNLYIADYSNHCIRKVDTAGIISTVAGNGVAGFDGDGGPATAAQLNWPYNVAIDNIGNLYIADSFNDRIRKVNIAGVISTIAGGEQGFSGDGGPATDAQFDSPHGVAVDSNGNLYIADNRNSRIRKIDTAGIISTIAGNGVKGFSGDGGPATAAQLYFPYDVAVDNSGNLFIADTTNNCIRKVDTAGIISTIAGNGDGDWGFSGDGGPATAAQLDSPCGIAIDSNGNLYIADTSNNRIRKVNTAGIIYTVVGSGDTGIWSGGFGGDGGTATTALLNYPMDVAIDNSNLYIADQDNNRIRRVFMVGDVNGDFEADLKDGISILQVIAGQTLPKVFVTADVNGDGKIGIEEAVFALKKLAE